MAQPTWITPAGSIGTYPYGIAMTFILSATPVDPATTITYSLLSGTLPTNLTLKTSNGLISGIPTLVTQNTTSSFTIRATDNLGNIRDRTFSITVSGTAVPQFTTPAGSLRSIVDSTWTQIQVQYSNPDTNNTVVVDIQEGILPPGLELSPSGLIQGYALPPTINLTLATVTTTALSSVSASDYIFCVDNSINSTMIGRPVVFTNTFGDLVANQTYYIRAVNSTNNSFSISATEFGSTLPLADATGTMTVTLPSISTGQPTKRTYSFVLRLLSSLGGNIASYSITVTNQNLSISQGGPGLQPNSRPPTILNTRPLVIAPTDSDPYYGYYILPPIPPTQAAQIGTIQSDNYFAFKILGHDFDGNDLQYVFSNLPSWMTSNSNTGWLTGYPVLPVPGISNYNFTVSTRKVGNPSITSGNFSFSLTLSLDISGNIEWITTENLGIVYNGSISTLKVLAASDVALQYRITAGSLPPDLQLLSNGEIIGIIADQPTSQQLDINTTTNFSFTIEAYSTTYTSISSSKTFNVNVYQQYNQPTDILYIEASPSLQDRKFLSTLLNNDALIPPNSLYRPTDVHFGKATSVIYEHAYGIYASDINQYIEAIKYKNHYWRNLTLGELKTAVAKDDAGNIIYEVVYSEVIDNLVNPAGVSVPKTIYWPRAIDLNLGPWYTSVTNIFTSYINLQGQQYYTSLSPGYASTLYPNSLFNMRTQVADVLGQVYNSTLLPQWMTSQQANGSTLGYTQAWVICYTKPGFSDIVKTNIETNWGYTNPQGNFVHYALNQVNFEIDRFSVNKSATYDWDNGLTPPAWTGLPSATPTPDPLNSQDFYVLFPRQTILPDETQY
jgi:Putative Ig domain